MSPHPLAAYEVRAREVLDPVVWQYLSEGSGEGHTLAANRRALDAAVLMPRPLADVRGGHTRLELFGQRLEHPLILAPVAYQRLFHGEGERASALAAAAQGGAFVASSLASQPFETIGAASREGGGVAPWFQLYWQGERARTRRLLDKARTAGLGPVVFTVDAPVKLATLQLDGEVSAVNLEAPLAACPVSAEKSQVFDGWMAQAPTWDDLAWLREQVTGPLIVKGILHPDDAARCVELGCDGVIVSNHGGRVLDGAPSSLAVLPDVVSRVGEQVPVLFDSGIRNGRDAIKAMALGASAVLVGRPYLWGLAAAGALGVAQTIRVLRDELEAAMALAGWRDVLKRKPYCL